MAVPLERGAIAPAESVTGDSHQFPRRQIGQHRARRWQVVERIDTTPGLDLSPQGPKIRRQRVRHPLGSASHEWPSARVTEQAEEHTEDGARRLLERQDRVRGQPGEERASALALEPGLREAARGPEYRQAEGHESQGMARQPKSPEHIVHDHGPAPREPSDTPSIGVFVGPEVRGRRIDVALQDHGGAVVEGMRQRARGVDELEAVLAERQRREERRADDQGIDRRADVVDVPGQRQLGGSHSAADRVSRLDDEHRPSRPCERDRGGEPVGAAADDDGIERGP